MNVYGKFTDMFKYSIKGTAVLRSIFLLLTLTVLGASNAFGVTITYHIINLGRLNDDGTISTIRTEALQFTSTDATLGVPAQYKSPLAKNWKYYQASEVTYNSGTKVCTFNSEPTLSEGDAMASNEDIYVTYELDETALSNFIVNDGDICNIKFNDDKYLYQSEWQGDPNTASAVIANPTTTSEYCWKINIKDPYQVTIQSKSDSYNDFYLSSTPSGEFPNIRLKNGLSTAKNCKIWAFGLLSGGATDTYRLVVADGYTTAKNNNNKLDDFGHGYLNNQREGYKTTYQLYEGTKYLKCDLEFEPIQQTYTYHIVDTHGNIAISYTMSEATATGQALNGYASIPAAIRSPYIADETITFYNHADCADQHLITKTPPTRNIYVKYTTSHLDNKFLHLRGARAMNVKINGELIYDDNGSLSHQAGDENTTKPYLWYFSGEDPYAIEISNGNSGNKLGYASSPSSLLYAESPENTKFILMTGSANDTGDPRTYEQMELMAATVDGNYYRVGRTGDAFSISTTTTGDASLQIKVNPVTIPATFKLIDKAGKILKEISSTSGAVELPDEWKSPLVSEYQYWKESAFTIEGDVYTLKAEPDESDKVISVTDVSTIYVTYKVNDNFDFNTTADAESGSTYRLKFVNGESFKQENGKDAVMTEAQEGVYPYFCGDGMFYVYGDEQWNTQLSSGASTRSRWLWYVVRPTRDPYHVKIMSNQLNAKPINTSHGYFRTFPVTYTDRQAGTEVTRYVTSLTTLEDDAASAPPTEYMVLTGADDHCKLVAIIDGVRHTVNSFEQYWKNNPTVQNTLGNAKVTQEETYSGNITLTDQQEAILPTYWHTYQSLVNSAPWVGWTGDGHSGTGRQYKNKNHWFQTVNMSTAVGSDGEFEFVETTLQPQVILVDNHGWEIMRKPLYDKDGNVNAELKLYDSPMVQNYYWHPTSTKADGYHKYNINEGDDVITIYYKNDAGKWVPNGETTTHTSTTLFDSPYSHITPTQDKSVMTDFYVTYDVKPEYANLYKGAATEEDVNVSAFWVKQGTEYAKNEGNALTTTTVETDDNELKWNVKPNFNIDAEMGYQYSGEHGEKTKSETEEEYVAAGKNGFDPYNIQIQSVSNPFYYFKTNTTGSHLSGGWSGTSTDLILQQMSSDIQNNVEGNDQTKLSITNATFMAVKDERDHMLLMPRFDHTKVVNSFSGTQLVAPGAATQTLELKMAPKVIHYSSEFAGMNGQYFLAEDFEFVEGFESLGSAESPFTGSIDGGLHTLKKGLEYLTTPLIAYADGAIIKNIILDEANITTGTNVGAIVANATGETRIYNCGINGGSIGGSGNVGGIVGNLHGEEITEGGKKKYVGARVINCYSYATITGGTNVGGIVGNNDFASTSSKIATMVMNCMFYGDITGGSNKSPVYGGTNIANLHGGLNTYNYYAYQQLPTSHITDGKYNSALAIYEKYLNRFEFYRLLLNSNKKLAAYYASSSEETVKPSDMMKWVLETADRSIVAPNEPKPYPVLKPQGYYPSIINYDTRDLDNYSEENRNKGLKIGELTVNINLGSGYPDGASIKVGKSSISLVRTDKDFDRFNFNYDKIQLPYYNDVGTGNYTHNKVVTGWKITSITGGTPGTYETGDKWNGYNFADRKCTNKDLCGTGGSNRVFSQGAYFDVPYGVTAITIEPYWGEAVYVADEYLDVVYNTGYTAQNVLDKQFPTGKITINNSEQTVYKSISAALSGKSSSSVYDLAVVLVGNLHQSNVPSAGDVPFTVMSADLDHDNEPDYSMIYHHSGRTVICPIRFDFLNIPGTCQAQKPNGVSKILNFTIFKTKGWFETTNTCLVYSNQVEYENREGVNGDKIANSPLILLGGDFEQFVSTQKFAPTGRTNYIHVGCNVNIDNFGLGTHGDGANATPHIPVSVTGGEFKGFYLTGTYNPNAAVKKDDAECYISGGHFVEAAGACQEQIDGNVQWQIYDADIDAFFGGGINDVKPIKGAITTDIFNSHVKLFCGGPKFGDMTTGKAVTTRAEGCVFDEYFGAGYGGLSYSRIKYNDDRSYNFNSTPYQSERGKYYTGTGASTSYAKKGPGVATDFDYEFFVWSSGETGSRKYVKFASFSLAQCDNVSSTLTGCTINGNYYGGGSLGKVVGTATSVLDGCTVHGNVFGGGYSANIPKVPVLNAGTGLSKKPSYNSNTGMFEPGEFSGTTDYEWKHVETLPSDGNSGFVTEEGKNYVVTGADLTTLGQVKETDLTVTNNCLIEGGVYGGGDESAVYENTLVKIENAGGENAIPNVYGGGNTADVEGNTEVRMTSGTVSHDIYGGGRGQTTIVGGNVIVNMGAKTGEAPSITYSGSGVVQGDVYGGSALGKVNTTADKTTMVNVYRGTVNGSVFGGGLGQLEVAADPGNSIAAKPAIVAENQGNTTINVEGGLVKTAVYGGSNVNGVLTKDATVTIIGGTIGDSENPNNDVVFGGGKGAPTLVNGNVTVNVGTMTPATPPAVPTYTGTATIYGHVYGGGALGNTNASKPESVVVFDATKKTLVNLYAGTLNGYAYGGGLGSAETPAYVGGDVTVTLDGAKVQQVFGANNINGTPKGHVKVWVKRTNNFTNNDYKNNTTTPRTSRTTYDVEAVYGGGNQADYIPTDALLNPALEGNPAKIAAAIAEVVIEGCDKTSINAVYGGGNAAAVPATDVTVKGSYIINTLYGGGNGAGFMDPPTNSIPNPGANVGIYKDGETPTNYGTGKAVTKLLAGYINEVYGGSNTKGDVRGGTDVRTKEKAEVITGDCCTDLNVGQVYGAGSQADVKGDVKIILECMPDDFVDAVYGGAKNATINGNVTLTVTSGKFGRVFGGNNEGGSINGSITVNVYEDGCKPLIIGELYGGGNAAPYSIYGCTQSGDTWTANESGDLHFDQEAEGRAAIQVNVVACTSVGKVFGGGMGTSAKVIGNTNVDVNLIKGIVNGNKQSTIGKVGQVFGGGGFAEVKGNTLVEVGTKLANEGEDEGVNIISGTDYLDPSDGSLDETITAGIYGGGYSADIDGNTTLNIGTKDQRIGENPSVTIAGDIFGGGYGSTTHVTGDVVVNIGKRTNTALEGDPVYTYEGYANITGDVYGGSAQGKVNSYLNESVETASEGKTTHVNFYGGTIAGNIHGGGLGEDNEGTENDHAADVYGPVIVTMEKGSTTNTTVNNVFGCNNVLGTPKNTVTVNINGGTVNNSVYGGGNQAAYTPTESTSNYPAVNIINGTITENVFGGGLGTTATATSNPHVTIGDNVDGHVIVIKQSVYGGGSEASVDGNTNIVVNSGTIGTEGQGGPVYGNIYGGGYGSSANVRIGLVKGNTNITVNGGNVLHNIYGGGAYGSVGTYTYASEGANAAISSLATANTGKATIRIVGGTIGTDGHENGMIYGASRGDIDRPDAIQDNMAWVYDTEVIIGTEGQGEVVSTPSIKGSVYGSGENGHTYHNASVTIHSGMVGITDAMPSDPVGQEGSKYPYRGNVYGGGCGTDKYYENSENETHDGLGTLYNPTAGIVRGNATVTIDGGHVVRNVYGAGAMGSVIGQTTVNISDKSVIGANNSGGGYVYAAARGADDMTTDCATVGSTALNISGGTVWGSAFGGGQLGTVKGSVAVNVSGGVVKNDVYGGGALANTNTDNWNTVGSATTYVSVAGLATETYRVKEMAIGASVAGLYTYNSGTSTYEAAAGTAEEDVVYYERLTGAPVAGYYTESAGNYTRITNSTTTADGVTTYYKKVVAGSWADGKNDPSTGTTYKTTVSLTGGLVGNVYGGGLGNTTTMANVYGDVTVSVNQGVTDPTKGVAFIQQTENPTIGGTVYPTPVSGRVFGGNNHNGTPTGNITVHVYSTRQLDSDDNILPGHGSPDRKYSYEIQSVYGGGNQADYLPATGKKSHVIIDGCDETSIEKVYGGGNSAVVPETDVLINGAYDIGYAFGGGNGDKPIKLDDGTWRENEGAIVIGLASIICQGGKIGQVFGGGDAKGSCGNTNAVTKQDGDCPLHITRLYGAGNKGDVSSVNIVLAACSESAIDYVHGGSYNAHVHGDVHLTITSGILKNVYGGNDARGGIEGNIIVDIEETNGCNPIIIQNLVGGGNEAPYPGTKTNNEGVEVPIGTHGKITVNVKSATRIDNIYGGSFMAEADADTEVNINMIKGNKAGTIVDIPKEFSYIPNINILGNNPDGKTISCQIDDAIGTIGNVYGGGNMGLVKGDTKVNIGASTNVQIMARNGDGKILDNEDTPLNVEDGKNITATIKYTDQTPLGVHVTGDVFGGGREANVTNNTFVNICANPDTYVAVAEGTEKVTISNGSVFGGGSAADVFGNTNVTMSGGYVFNGIFGGGYAGSVGTFTRSTEDEDVNVYGHTAHADCIGKPVSCAENTGKCTVVVNAGQIGPNTVATQGMNRPAAEGGPVPEGWIWGGSQGLIQDPDEHPDTHFLSYVGSTDVTIGGTALIMESIIGGGEFGRVLGNTLVKIEGGQIGIGEGKIDGNNQPIRYTDDQFVNPLNTTINAGNALTECSHFPYGRDTNSDGKPDEFLPYDPYYEEYPAYIAAHPEFGHASTENPSDGKTWIGCVFGGGSGYMPYKKRDGSGYDWCRSAGLVEGNTEVRISGGHILTNVYGANEITDVKGQAIISMTGGTIGVPRTEAQIAEHPLTCYLFGGGKGDERPRFFDFNDVGSVDIDISGGIIYGSVFGGSEDGHVLGNINLRIRKGDDFTIGSTTYTNGPIIGTWGTTYVEGNVFGGGRGFSGETLTAGSTGGNVTMSIEGGTMRGSVYGGGRLASVGIGLNPPEHLYYGQLKDETGGNSDPTYGHVTINISGGTIGNGTTETGTGHPVSGNVFGGSMGRITMLDGKTRIPLWPKQAVIKLSNVTISGGTIYNSVYGGGEIGIVRNHATVNVSGGTIHGNVFGGGYGSDEQDKKTISAGGYDDIPTVYYTFTPMMWTGCVSGDTEVNISGGSIMKNVYGGGNYASVGLMNYNSSEDGTTYNYITKHDTENGFGLSWPYEFQYIKAAPTDGALGGNAIGGKTTVNITGGRIGTTANAGYGNVFGGSKGMVTFKKEDNETLITDVNEQRYAEAFCANVRETAVNINYANTPESDDGSTTQCIVGAVYGGAQDGHVYEDANVTITKGLIGLSVYGGGQGESTFLGKLRDQSTKDWKATTEDVHSITAGKVYGNTSVSMTGGTVVGHVYGGGNLASVGKGNYAGGADDYYPAGYGEKLTGNLWASASVGDNAWHFLNSGNATVTITGGKVGTPGGTSGSVYGTTDATPTGLVFGGSRGRASEDIMLDPRHEYAPDFYLGYVNNTSVTIGSADGAPNIYSQVFGGGRDGHVRNNAHVVVNNGFIGQPYNDFGSTETDDYQRYHRGNVYGAGSGLGVYDGTHHGISSGSVTNSTTVDINGGTIYNNVYGGGALACVGPPRLDPEKDYAAASISKCTVNINGGTIGEVDVYNNHKFGGTIYGGSRGDRGGNYNDLAEGESIANYATVLWTEVNINPHPTNRNNDAVLAGNVYGGARGGQVKKDTKVNLLGGIIKHNAYGGGRGTTAIAADVLGNTTVELNKDVADNAKGCIVDKVFGCNDLNGTPKGHVLVHVYGTQNRDKDDLQTKVGPGLRTSLNKGESEEYIVYMNRLIALAKDGNVVKTGIDEAVITTAQATITGKVESSLTDGEKTAISNAATTVIAELQKLHGYDVTAVYGGGDLAPYVPTVAEDQTEVIIEGCDVTSIKQVYGGGNAAYAPATNVLVKSAYVIDELFGGGNGLDNYIKDGKWYENPGANVGYKELEEHVTDGSNGDGSDEAHKYGTIVKASADTPEGRKANYSIGTGIASTTVNGGYIHNVYGGSNKKGNIRAEALLQVEQVGTCTLITDEIYSGSKEATIDAETNTVLDCVKNGGTVYGGSYNADILNDVHIRITNGHYAKVFGGNNKAGTITGSITIDVEEHGCTPIEIDELYAGGYLAPYSVYGYSATTRDAVDENGNAIHQDDDPSKPIIQQRIPYKKGDTGALATPSRDPQINIISATKIGKIYGGGYHADLIGSPHINVNMTRGVITEKYASEYPELTEKDSEDNSYLPIGTIGTIFGGGNKGDIYGDTYVEIGTGKHHTFTGEEETITPARNAAYIMRESTGGQVFGGGDQGYVFGNTNVIIGNGYIYDRVYGGGNEGTVGTVSTRALPAGHTHDSGCLGGKPTAFAENTGRTAVTVSGGYVGPYIYTKSESTGTAAISPMTMPQDFGYVFGAGRGKMGNPAVEGNKDIEFMTYVDSTRVTISGSALIAGGVYGGSENGRVLHNTGVYIEGGQIGLGAGRTTAYAEEDFIDPTTATAEQIATKAGAMAECAHWAYGSPWLPYDENADNGHYQTETYGAASTTGYDGHTFYGNVFGGGSGYFAYETTTAGVYEWLPSAGLVEGDTYVNISGGHILTNVYGGNEMTNITGTAHVTMTGGTLGVPRTLAQIAAHPLTCYLFGGGKGDQRVHFNKSTNVGHAKVNVSGGIIYGSVFGGGEDGHVLGNVDMNISDGAKIGTWGTSYVDGNVFGGGRGFGGDAYTAGNVAGTVTLNITGGTMLGSVYGGGRLGSVGYGLFSKDEAGYGTMRDDGVTEDGFMPPGGLTKGRGHVVVNISGDNTVIGNKYEYQYISPETTGDALAAAKTYLPSTQFENNNRLKHTRGGNVFAGGMGRYTQLDGTTPISTYDGSGNLTSPIEWKKLGNVKSTKLTISGNPWIMGNVYGGGEFGVVQGSHQRYNGNTPLVDAQNKPIVSSTEILFSGGTIGTEITTTDPEKVQYTYGSIYAGGMGQEMHDATDNHGGDVKDSTYVSISGASAKVRASVFGGGEMAVVEGSTRVNISNGEIGRNEVKPADDADAGYVLFGGATMGNVYGGGKGVLEHTKAGLVKGNTNVSISGGNVYHNVYGGGALASVGTFDLSNGTDAPDYIPIAGVPYNWTANTGTATVTVTGGTIGISGRDNGLVFGSSRGGLQKPVDEDPGEGEKLVNPYDRVAWVNKSVVTIGTNGSGTTLNTPLIKGSVYGGGENGHNDESATVNVYSGTIGVTDTADPWYYFTDKTLEKSVQLYRGNVYGAGSGSDTYTGDDGKEYYNPKSGMVGGNTFVNIAGGHVGHSVYGGGAMASVGTITNAADTVGVAKHASETASFALSWPYKFEFAANTGKATVNVTGGHIGTRQLEGGDVYGSSRGVAGDRYTMAHLAFTNETEVNITYPETIEMTSEAAIQNDLSKQCITGSVHGSGENGYVYGDTKVTLNKGLIGHSLYGAGKGKGTYIMKLNDLEGSGKHDANIYSLIAGKVMGNTEVTMNDGHVGRNVYGGGNMGSVGKGNYAGGTDDYVSDCDLGAAQGYGEKINGNLWTSAFNPEAAISESNKPDDAYYFLSSGKTTVKVLGGIVGYIDATDPTVSMKNQLPYGNVFGGSAGEAAPNIAQTPRYLYSPAFFSGFVNETDVTIGQDGSGPTILGSVYGGGQDGHVRRDTKVTVLGGEIGVPYNSTNQTLLKTDNLDSPQWIHRGNIYGGGSGITKFKYDFNYDGDTEDANEQDYSNSSGSVTRFTEVNVKGGTVHRNVYGGGSMGSVGAPNMGQTYELYKPGQADIDGKPANGPGRQSMNTVNIGGGTSVVTIGTPFDEGKGWTYNKVYGGEVYGACRGLSTLDPDQFANSVWTKVNIKDKATIMGNVYGGGDSGIVKKNSEVKIGE